MQSMLGDVIQEENQQTPQRTTTQSLLGEMSMKKASNHYQCKTCLEMLPKKRANNHHSAELADRDVHEESQQPLPMQSMLGDVIQEESQQTPQRTATQNPSENFFF